MKIQRLNHRRACLRALLCCGALAAAAAGAAQSTVTQQIDPAQITLDDAAQLTIAASGDTSRPISPPMVSGLEFIAVGQSQRVESVNGVTHATTAVTYQVIPHRAGVFNIPGGSPGSAPVVLTVTGAGAGAAAGTSAPSAAGSTDTATASPGTGKVPGGPVHMSADGAAFVRLALPKHDLYVGETIPIDIQVGTRDGMVASMNGPPTLNGDAFVLEKLSNEPQRSSEMVGGEPFTVFTWHSALAAVKPGSLSLTMETPLTVRMRAPARTARQIFDNPDDFFDDASLQSFFGGSTQRDISVASTPAQFTVLALPGLNRPADFSGAVGHFTVTSQLGDARAEVGDPLTLQLKIAGTGNFDRVDTPMLHDLEHWKTYAPTTKFTPSDDIGTEGVKIFEQPLIATLPGAQKVPSLSFSWFDPDTRRYQTAHTAPLTAAISAAPGNRSVAKSAADPAARVAANPPINQATPDGLRIDHVEHGRGVTTLRPHFLQPAYIAAPSLVVVILSGVLLFLRRREQATDGSGEPSLATDPLIKVMDDASSAGDAEKFFKAARLALQRTFSPKWHLKPETITIDDVEAHLDVGSDVARVFRLADETSYAGSAAQTIDFQRWRRLVLRRIHSEALS